METVSVHRTGPCFLIADDHAIFAAALRAYLEKSFRVVGVALDGRAMIAEAIRLRPDVVVVDVGMPLLNGIDAARRVKEQAPKIKFIFLTMHDDANLASAALELGPSRVRAKTLHGTRTAKSDRSCYAWRALLDPQVADYRLGPKQIQGETIF